MTELPSIYRRFSTQLWYVLLSAAFFFYFMAVYQPFGTAQALEMGRDLFIMNVTLMMCIVLVSLTITRSVFYLLRKQLSRNWWVFSVWILVDLVVLTYFLALYLYLMGGRTVPYFQQLAYCLQYTFLVLVYPYFGVTVVCSLIVRNETSATTPSDVIRFVDASRQVRIVLRKDAILYIRAAENFVHIHYLDAGKVKVFPLRSTMQALAPLAEQYGFFRCQRSYFVNLSHISTIRKEAGDVISLEIDVPEETIPVSRRVYHTLLERI